MTKLTRRKVLMGVLLGGVTATTIHEFFRLRTLGKEQTLLTETLLRSPTYTQRSLDAALNADKVATANVESIQNSVNLLPPTVPYSRSISKPLIQGSRLGTEQYFYGKYQQGYDGSIKSLPSYTDRLNPYTQVASIIGPDESEISENIDVPDSTPTVLPFSDPLRVQLDNIERVVKRVAGQSVSIKWKIPVYWGFVLSSPQANMIIFRGTQQTNEWLQNLLAVQVEPTVDRYPFDFEGKVHRGFANLYAEVADQVIVAAQQLNPAIPCYVSGHSLGASLATLAALDIANRVPALKIKSNSTPMPVLGLGIQLLRAPIVSSFPIVTGWSIWGMRFPWFP
ncbi:MAG: lipase family protein [Oscillatoriales cyanobacterium RM2_1_1]|nr:lipase family protein [Oscillatoriales cyanobacterium RM2_1_1]